MNFAQCHRNPNNRILTLGLAAHLEHRALNVTHTLLP